MSVENLVSDPTPKKPSAAGQMYLRAVVVVARAGRAREYAIVHFGSGQFLRTDRLGALAVRAMIDGSSDTEAVAAIEELEAGAGGRARQLIDILATNGALSPVAPSPSDGRRRLRRRLALLAGSALSLLNAPVRLAPIRFLALAFKVLPATPIIGHVWRSRGATILYHVQSSGFAGRPRPWLVRVARESAACTPVNYFFMYLSVCLPHERLNRVLDHLFEPRSAADVARQLNATGATVGVFLHDTLCAPVPNVLRARGVEVVRTINGRWHGSNVSEGSGQLSYFFGDRPEMTVEITHPLAAAELVRHLKAGRSVHIALDRSAGERRTAKIEMLGHRFSRNDGPAWLAVRSGRPLALWTTHPSASGVVIKSSPPLYPDPMLPVELRVAALSERLYEYAESAIQAHPETWACWSYLTQVIGEAGDLAAIRD